MNWSEVQKFLVDLAPYYLPLLIAGVLEYNRRKAETRRTQSEAGKTDAEASKTMVEAAQAVVDTSGVVIDQLEGRLSSLGADYQKVQATLEDANRRYVTAMEEISRLSQLLLSLRNDVSKLTTAMAEKDLHIANLTKCVRWLLFYLRPLAPAGLFLPKPWDVDLWVSRASELNGMSETEVKENNATQPPSELSGE